MDVIKKYTIENNTKKMTINKGVKNRKKKKIENI